MTERMERQKRISDSKGASPENTATGIEDDGSKSNSHGVPVSPQATFQQLGLESSDLSIILGTAERLLPSVTEFVRDRLGVE